MTERSWFYARQGQQQGPCSEAELRDLMARGDVTPDTLVWTEGMANWQRAGDIQDLLSGGAANAGEPGGALSIEFGIWDFVWRSIVVVVGLILIIPTPWVVAMYCRWIVSHTRVPGRPNLSFAGRATTLIWYFVVLLVLIVLAVMFSPSGSEHHLVNAVSTLVQFALYWMLIKWVVANISSNGQPLGLQFSGSFWVLLGWNLLVAVSFITIIGWAWVYTAQLRWIARHIQGTRREVVYTASGLEFLWRTLVTMIACLFIIPIPWILRWKWRWQASQFVLVPRTGA